MNFGCNFPCFDHTAAQDLRIGLLFSMFSRDESSAGKFWYRKLWVYAVVWLLVFWTFFPWTQVNGETIVLSSRTLRPIYTERQSNLQTMLTEASSLFSRGLIFLLRRRQLNCPEDSSNPSLVDGFWEGGETLTVCNNWERLETSCALTTSRNEVKTTPCMQHFWPW